MTAWVRRHPLALWVPLQALLYCWNLALLAPWGDEAGTLLMVRGPLRTLVRWAAEDVHPPLYYSLLFCWQRVPLGLDWAVQARLLSVVLALAGTVAMDRLWAARLEERLRWILLALWTLSPCLLLYARMCRSYTLQALCSIVAVAMLVRVTEAARRRNTVLLAMALLAAMYTHYVAGIALVAMANLVLLRRGAWRPLLAVDGMLAVGYLPWVGTLAASLAAWGNNGRSYALTGSRVLEVPVKFAYWCMSFVMGEAIPDWALIAGFLLMPLVAIAAWRGTRGAGLVAWIAAGLGVVGFVGVARWVSYPFVPARMLFVLPLFLLLVARGAASRWGRVAVAGMLLMSVSGIACYFNKAGFRNKEYPMPIGEIAGRILRESRAENSIILVDSANSDHIAMLYALHPGRSLMQTGLPETQQAIANALEDPRIHAVWFLRSTRDITGVNGKFQAMLRARMSETVHPYEAYTPLERRLMGAGAPAYFQELLEYRK